MKKLLVVSLILAFALPAAAFAGCKEKIASLERQLAIAKTKGNSHRVAGLERALANAEANCSDANLKAKHDSKVKDKELKVRKAEMELEEAKRAGKKSKIASREEKLEKAKRELEEARAARAAG